MSSDSCAVSGTTVSSRSSRVSSSAGRRNEILPLSSCTHCSPPRRCPDAGRRLQSALPSTQARSATLGGTLLNAIAVLFGGLTGLVIGRRLGEGLRGALVSGIGLVTVVVGVSNAGQSGNIIIPLVSIVSGVVVGELLEIDRRLQGFAAWMQGRVGDSSDGQARARFINGYLSASLVFCVGPLTFVGSLQDGMGLPIGFQQLAIKSVLDMITAATFAASMGVGVLFSIVTILALQGGLALLGSTLGEVMSVAMIAEMTAVGGVILIGLALVLLELRPLRVANFLPALIIAPLLVALAEATGIILYPF
ncbi:MAG: DUF554 domain-containing protein [Anaerolineaceae bacterium]|nr:DUF554 domain-containing protein [Anaerolineaceae bacterium]